VARQFKFYVEPEEIRQYLTNSGYETADVLHRERNEVIGFRVLNMSVVIGYDLIFDGRVVAQRLIALESTPPSTDTNSERTNQSLKLYLKLYRRFHNLPSDG